MSIKITAKDTMKRSFDSVYCRLLMLFSQSAVFMKQRSCAWVCNPNALLFTALILIHLTPLWTFKYFPTQDGPIHLNIANIIREYHNPDYSVFRTYYALNKDFDPNWFVYLILTGLMSLVPVLTAEKLLLSGYVILLPISMHYALCALRPTAGFLAIFAFPFIYNFIFHMGFYNFSYSLPMFFFLIGYWLKHRDGFTLGQALTFALLSLVLYACHLVSLVMAYVAIAVLTGLQVLLELSQQVRKQRIPFHTLWKILGRRVLIPFAALLPTLFLVILFLGKQGTGGSGKVTTHGLLRLLFNLEALVSYQSSEVWCSRAVVGLFVAVSLFLLASKVVHRQLIYWDRILLVAVVYLALYYLTPNEMSGGGWITTRLSLYPFFAMILWFGAQPQIGMLRRKIQISVVSITLAFFALHVVKYAELNKDLEEYFSGVAYIEPNTTLLPLCFTAKENPTSGPALLRTFHTVAPFYHAASLIAAQRHIVDFTNFQLSTGYFPAVFRPPLDPYTYLDIGEKLEAEPPLLPGRAVLVGELPRADFLTYPRLTGGQIDYVLVWGIRNEQLDLEYIKIIFQQLTQQYDLIYTSPPRGLMQLYRRKGMGK